MRFAPVHLPGEQDAVHDDALLVAALRAGDERAFGHFVDRYYGVMLARGRDFVATREAAEDVVQDMFLRLINGIDRFEGRSSLRTCMFRIVVNWARTRGERESRTRPFSSLPASAEDGPSVDPDRFVADGRWAALGALRCQLSTSPRRAC